MAFSGRRTYYSTAWYSTVSMGSYRECSSNHSIMNNAVESLVESAKYCICKITV